MLTWKWITIEFTIQIEIYKWTLIKVKHWEFSQGDKIGENLDIFTVKTTVSIYVL